MRVFSVALFLAALCCSAANAATPEEALASRFRAAAAMIDAQLTKEATPGAAIGVVHDQVLIWSHQYGVESLDTGTPVTNDTLFSICSISKLFNGVAAMDLVEDGRLSLDTPIASYLDGLGAQDETGAEEPITVRNILSHISGLPREAILDYWADNTFPDTDGLRKAVTEQEQLYRPFDYWQYSNLGMAMLGDVVEIVSGKPWGDLVPVSGEPLVPADFDVPEVLETDRVRLRMLTVNDVVRDYDVVVSSTDHLQATFSSSSWPIGLTLEQNLIDLGWHQKEFQQRTSFAFTVVSLDEDRVLGCVYIYPFNVGGYDARAACGYGQTCWMRGWINTSTNP